VRSFYAYVLHIGAWSIRLRAKPGSLPLN